MKTRLVTSFALAAVVSLSLTGCGLIAPQATLEHYAPSDGIEFNIADVEVRNLMLITDADAEQFNVVFVGVNNGEKSAQLSFRFESAHGSGTASADFRLPAGSSSFGDPEGKQTIVSLSDTPAGSTVTAHIQVPGGEIERQVPVIDGTLKLDGDYAFPEYRALVP